jgi:type IV pilus assembly protein PilB
MAKKEKSHFSELSDFIRDAESAARVGAPPPGAPSAGGRPAGGAGMMRDIEDAEEAGARIGPGGGAGAAIAPVNLGGDDKNMLQMLARQQGMQFVRLPDLELSAEARELFPADFARENKVLPLYLKPDGTMVVAIADPLNVTIADHLRLLLDRPVEVVVAEEKEIGEYLDQLFSHSEDIDKVMEDLTAQGGLAVDSGKDQISLDPEDLVHAPPVIKLVNLILMRALRDGASDLHIEPFAATLRVRYRVDGVLREIPPPPKSLQIGLTSRFKVMANMNISETRRPQDGRIRLTHQGRDVDLRVSVLPTVHGESLVMRILDKAQMMVGIDQIGMTKNVRERFVEICKRPNGVVLVTGPTGCGKTTTLYAAIINRLNPEEKFITTEDPVEYEVPGLVQVNINANVGLTFASCLRAILRQDPDVILVGEIRDVETAQIAIQASLTGHLVYSTLHTNSSSGTVSRLIDMGIEPFLLTSTLQVVIGQRLVRCICQNCKTAYRPKQAELEDMFLRRSEVEGLTFYKGNGCDECAHSGYRKRLGLFEMLEMNDEMRELILERATADEIHELAFAQGMQTMRQDGLIKICMGVSTFHEVGHHTVRATPEEIRREVEPIIKQVRAKLLGETAPTSAPSDKAAPLAALPGETGPSYSGPSTLSSLPGEEEAAARIVGLPSQGERLPGDIDFDDEDMGSDLPEGGLPSMDGLDLDKL